MKLLGVDTSVNATQSQLTQGGQAGQQTSSIALQTSVRAADELEKSLQMQSQQSAANMRTARAAAGMAAEGQNAALQGSQKSGNIFTGLASLGQAVTGVLKSVEDRQAAEAKAKAEATLAQMKQNDLAAEQEAARLEVDMQNIMRDDPEGRVAVERQITALASRQDLTPEGRAKIATKLYGTLASLQGEQAKRVQSESDKIRGQKENQLVSRAGIQLSGILTNIGASDDPEQVTGLMAQFETSLSAIIQDKNLTDSARQAILTEMTAKLEGQSFRSAEAQVKTAEIFRNIAEFTQAAAQLKAKFDEDGDYAAYAQSMALIQQEFGISGELKDTFDPVKQQKAANDWEKTQRESKELEQAGLISALDAQEMDSLEMGSMAAQLVDDPAKLAAFEAEAKKYPNSTHYARIKGVVQAVQEYRTSVQKASREGSEINYAIAKLQQGNTEDVIRQMMKSTELAQTMGFAQQIAAMQAGKVNSQGQPADPMSTPEGQQLLAQLNNDKMQVARALEDKGRVINDEVANKLRVVEKYGFQQGQFSQAAYDVVRQRREAASQQFNAQRKAKEAGGSTPNFKALRTTYKGQPAILPFKPGFLDFDYTAPYNQPRGDRVHQGYDVGADTGTPLISPLDGVVTHSRWDDGFGNFVEVKLSDGTYHLYAHLDQPASVRVGQKVKAGQQVGVVGNTGRSFGAHLHWEVRDSNERLMNPMDWARQAAQKPQKAAPETRGMNQTGGPAPGQVPKGAIKLKQGYLFNGRIIPYDQPKSSKPATFTGAQPVRSSGASTRLSDFPKKNNPTANHGYKQLAQDKPFAAKVAQVADKLGIPAMWLVDVMAFESGGQFNPGQRNIGGAPAVGLIQFYEDAKGSGVKNIGGRDYRLTDIGAMSRVQQMDLVYEYLKPFKGQIKEPRHLLGAIFGGRTDLPLGAGDGDIRFGAYLQRLGEHSGRRYYGPNGVPLEAEKRVSSGKVDRTFNANCTSCKFMASNDQFVPHTRQSISGSISDYIG